MKQLRQWGNAGESLAREFLEKKGYRCLASNYQTRWGEIDLVMEQGATVVFVEVKRRDSVSYGSPEEAVSGLKQSRMARVALWFMRERRLEERMIRFDVIAIDNDGIRHLEDAFSVEPGSYYY